MLDRTNLEVSDGTVSATLEQALGMLPFDTKYAEAALVGSAYTMGAGQDIDLLLLVDNKDVSRFTLTCKGAEVGGSSDPLAMQDCWESMRLGKLNILLCDDEEFFEKWKTAAEVCKYLKLGIKQQRVDVHRIIMDGLTAEGVFKL